MITLLALLAVLPPQLPQTKVTQVSPPRRIELSPTGAFAHVPPEGLHSVDGPSVVLRDGWADWYGVAFVDGVASWAGVGAGRQADWAERTPVETLGTRGGNGWVQARARLGPLGIETLVEERGELVLVTVLLENHGENPLGQLFYTREWLVPGATGWSFPPDFPVPDDMPAELARRVWMLDDLAPGKTNGLVFSFRVGPPRQAVGVPEVPLALWTDASWPEGLNVGSTNGVSFGDFDADGWIDVFACQAERLLRNVNGTTWEIAADLSDVMSTDNNRYGASFGDHDNDGLPDIATEPRSGCMDLLHNLGGTTFENVANDPVLFPSRPCSVPSETICWGDVDDDGDLDCFLPVYAFTMGPGNFFWENLGPTGPGGAYRFQETSAAAGVNNPPGTARPEGAQFVDVDRDGDMDLYSNGTLYENRSEGEPQFVETNSIGLRAFLEEGAAFFDYDLDGDQDLAIVYTLPGVRIWEAFGDGTFVQVVAFIEEPLTGLNLGLSAEDWDMDGDVDFTTRQVFRRNQFIEQDGVRRFSVATTDIPPGHLTSATPSWGDWDRDGDLDCALGNWQSVGHFYENTLWSPSTPADQKPYLRVRVARDHPDLPRGLETEYGATVEVLVQGDTHRRQKFVASGHGYLNQNEYALHFALPAGPNPAVPVEGIVCDVVVDFPSRASSGVLRIDRHVNPALGDLRIADLADREIVVFRSGRVTIDGVVHAPDPRALGPRLFATGGGLTPPDPELGLPEVTDPAPDRWIGIELRTPPAGRVLVKELVVDGRLFPLEEEGAFNLAVWDVTDRQQPVRVHEALESTSARNRRTFVPFVVTLEPGRVYRVVANVERQRLLPIVGPRARHGLALEGGLEYVDTEPATGRRMRDAPLVPDVGLSLRYVTGFDRRAVVPR